MNRERRIAHLDMDAFYASVELLRYPELRGQAVVVGGRSAHQPVRQADGAWEFSRLHDYVGRGVVTTSTYEARARGVFSGMGLMKSAREAPEAILLPADFDAYRYYSQCFKAAVAAIAPKIEDRGIDEIYIDLSDLDEDSTLLASQIKRAVHAATGLTCSIGISPNKTLSKIASELQKPDGVTVLTATDWRSRVWPLPTGKINGIGPKASARLAQLGIVTIGELAAVEASMLVKHFGLATGRWMHQVAHGVDERDVVIESVPKSFSRESTFERDLHVRHDRAALSEIFTGLCVRVADDLERKGFACRTIGIKLRYADFQSVTRDITLPFSVSDGPRIRRAAGECLKRVALDRRIRLLGVRASGLCPVNAVSNQLIGTQMALPL